MAIYVDDIIVMSKDMAIIHSIRDKLKQEFKIKELGELKYCLGTEVTRDRNQKSIFMNQCAYIGKVAERFGVSDCKDVYTPAEIGNVLVKMSEEETFEDRYPYREVVGSLMYALTCTRPDIGNAVGNVAKYCAKYNKQHWMAAKRIVKYLKTTSHYGIMFNGKEKKALCGHADANWAADLDSRRSTTEYIFLLNDSVISWRSQRQATVATSTTESEYMALYGATQEMIWLKKLLADLKYTSDEPTTMHQDSQGCIALATNPVYQTRTKHIDIKYYFIRDVIKCNRMVLKYTCSEDMLADGMTNDLSRQKHELLIKKLHMNKVAKTYKKLTST